MTAVVELEGQASVRAPLFYLAHDAVVEVDARRVKWNPERRRWVIWDTQNQHWHELLTPERFFTSNGTTLAELTPALKRRAM